MLGEATFMDLIMIYNSISYFQGITLNLSATRMLGMNKSMMLVCKKAFQYILKWLRTANHLKISEVLIQLGLNNNRMVRFKKP